MNPALMASIVENLPRPTPVGTSILDQLAEIEAHGLSPEMAHRLLDIRFDDVQQTRVAALAEKSQAGSLTPDERADYAEYVHVADVLAILKSKARQVLKKNPGKS
jgi:transglutaminase-like putative cysteine protease